MMMEVCEENAISLLDLAWEDILFEYVLPKLSLKDLFHLRSVSVRACRMVSSYFSTVKRFDLSPVSDTCHSNVALRVMTERCRNLRTLILSECNWVEEDLTFIFQANKFLTHVDLSGCTKLSESNLLSLASNCKMLKILGLRECNWLTHEGIEAVLTNLTMLQQVDFSSCTALTKTHVTTLLESCSNLTTLHLAYCKFVDDHTLSVIARNGQNISVLDIRCCMSVTDQGIRLLGEYATKLTALFVSNCHFVTEYSLRQLRFRGTIKIDRQSTFLIRMPLVVLPRLQV